MFLGVLDEPTYQKLTSDMFFFQLSFRVKIDSGNMIEIRNYFFMDCRHFRPCPLPLPCVCCLFFVLVQAIESHKPESPVAAVTSDKLDSSGLTVDPVPPEREEGDEKGPMQDSSLVCPSVEEAKEPQQPEETVRDEVGVTMLIIRMFATQVFIILWLHSELIFLMKVVTICGANHPQYPSCVLCKVLGGGRWNCLSHKLPLPRCQCFTLTCISLSFLTSSQLLLYIFLMFWST